MILSIFRRKILGFKTTALMMAAVIFIEQPLWALSNSRFQEIKTNINKLELLKKDLTLEEFIATDANQFPDIIKKPMEWVLANHPEVKLSKIVVTKIPSKKNQVNTTDDIQLQMNILGSPLVMTFVQDGDVVLKINGESITQKDIEQIFPYLKKVAKAVNLKDSDKYLNAVPENQVLGNINQNTDWDNKGPFVSYDVFKKMSQKQQLDYLNKVRLLMESMEEITKVRTEVINLGLDTPAIKSKVNSGIKKTSSLIDSEVFTKLENKYYYFSMVFWQINSLSAFAKGSVDYSNENCLAAGTVSQYSKTDKNRWSCGAGVSELKCDSDGKGNGILCNETFYRTDSDKTLCVPPDRGVSNATLKCNNQVSANITLKALMSGADGENNKAKFDAIQKAIADHKDSVLNAICEKGLDSKVFKKHQQLIKDQKVACNNFNTRYNDLKKSCEDFAKTQEGKELKLQCTAEDNSARCAQQFLLHYQSVHGKPVNQNKQCDQGKLFKWSEKGCQDQYYCSVENQDPSEVQACHKAMKDIGAVEESRKSELNCGGDANRITNVPNKHIQGKYGSPCGSTHYFLCRCPNNVIKSSCSDRDNGTNGGSETTSGGGFFSDLFKTIGDWFKNNWKEILKFTVISGVIWAGYRAFHKSYKMYLDRRFKNNSQDVPNTTPTNTDNSHLSGNGPPAVK